MHIYIYIYIYGGQPRGEPGRAHEAAGPDPGPSAYDIISIMIIVIVIVIIGPDPGPRGFICLIYIYIYIYMYTYLLLSLYWHMVHICIIPCMFSSMHVSMYCIIPRGCVCLIHVQTCHIILCIAIE